MYRPDAGPRKVMLFIPHLEQGGAERQILELMRRLPDRYVVSLCVYSDKSVAGAHYRDYLHGTRTLNLGVSEMGPRGLKRLVQLLRAEQPAILHSYRDRANLWARLAAMITPVPVVLTSVRNRYQGPIYGPAEYMLQRRSDRILTNSRGIEEELVSWSRVAPERIQVINNFIDLDCFQVPTQQDRDRARARVGFAPDDIVLLLPGRLAMQKHHMGLGLALAFLRRRRVLPPNVRVVFAGRARDKVYSRLVPHAMRLLGIDEHITYLEPVTDMLTLYHASDVLVMPSLFEGMPNAVLEAHASGLPAVVTHAANRDGVVIDGVSGYEAPTLDPIALARGIEKLLAATHAERRAMGARGRAHVAERFHPDRILTETIELYDSLLAAKGFA